jgi:hypothetical protein
VQSRWCHDNRDFTDTRRGVYQTIKQMMPWGISPMISDSPIVKRFLPNSNYPIREPFCGKLTFAPMHDPRAGDQGARGDNIGFNIKFLFPALIEVCPSRMQPMMGKLMKQDKETPRTPQLVVKKNKTLPLNYRCVARPLKRYFADDDVPLSAVEPEVGFRQRADIPLRRGFSLD